MDITKKHEIFRTEQRVISFCSGFRGIERGIEQAGIQLRAVCYVEIEAFVIANLVGEMEAGAVAAAPVWSNLETFDGSPFRGRIHGITGGYPCPPFSVAGRRKGADDPRHLWPYFERHIEAIRPIWCFFENVAGHLTCGFPEVYTSLRNLGYRVEAGLFTAGEIGATHKRERLFILAYSDGSGGRKDSKQGKLRTGRAIKSSYNSRQSEKAKAKQIQKWPARPDQKQHKWEAQRTIEPGMGCSIDGYNARNDLLRMYGNGVVPGVAAKAFNFLIQKHIDNGNY